MSLLSRVEAQLKAIDPESARLTAELLLAKVLSVERIDLYLHPERPLTEAQADRLNALISRRLKGEPLAYILGTIWFMGLEFEVNRHVLIPRPETEILVESLLKHQKAIVEVFSKFKSRDAKKRGIRIIDVGTGSGCIAVSLAKAFSGRNVYATDASAQALSVARRNASRHQVHVNFFEGNFLEPLQKQWRGCPVIVISNPPYIPSGDINGLSTDVRDYEPRMALDGGVDGLAAYRQILEQAKAFCVKGIAVEVGFEQARLVQALIEAHFPELRIQIIDDLSHHARVVLALEDSITSTSMFSASSFRRLSQLP